MYKDLFFKTDVRYKQIGRSVPKLTKEVVPCRDKILTCLEHEMVMIV